MNWRSDTNARTRARVKSVINCAAVLLSTPGVRLTLILSELLVVLTAASGYLVVISVLMVTAPDAVYDDNRITELLINAAAIAGALFTAMPFIFAAQRIASRIAVGMTVPYHELFYAISSPRAYFKSFTAAFIASIRPLVPLTLIITGLDVVASPPDIEGVTVDMVSRVGVLTAILTVLILPLWLYITRALVCLPYYLSADDVTSIGQAMRISRSFTRDRLNSRTLRCIGTRAVFFAGVSFIGVFLPALFHYVPLYLIAYPVGLGNSQYQTNNIEQAKDYYHEQT